MPYPGGATFDFPGQGVGGGRKWEDLGALRIKEVRVTRAKHSPVYHSMSRGGCQGEWGKSGEAREGGGWRGGIGIKKLVRTTPYRAQK